MTALAAAAAVTAATLIFSSWLALGAVLPILLCRRALLLAKRDPSLYGGYKTAMASLAVTLVACAGLSSYAITRVPEYFEKRKIREQAAQKAVMLHLAVLLEQYRADHGHYPSDLEPIKKLDGGSFPADFWTKGIKYKPYTEQVAATTFHKGGDATIGVEFNNDYELKLAGPDESLGTQDDIFMRDGRFFPNPDAGKPAPTREPLKPANQ